MTMVDMTCGLGEMSTYLAKIGIRKGTHITHICIKPT